jgi:hypothetical protein
MNVLAHVPEPNPDGGQLDGQDTVCPTCGRHSRLSWVYLAAQVELALELRSLIEEED